MGKHHRKPCLTGAQAAVIFGFSFNVATISYLAALQAGEDPTTAFNTYLAALQAAAAAIFPNICGNRAGAAPPVDPTKLDTCRDQAVAALLRALQSGANFEEALQTFQLSYRTCLRT